MSHLSLTTWSLHRELGPLRWTYWDEIAKSQATRIEDQPENTTLLQLPYILAEENFQSLEVCHFHFPITEQEYLLHLRDAFEKSGVTFHCLLIDYGDISNEDPTRRTSDIEFIKKWIDIAAIVGARSVRVVAGEGQPDNHNALESAKISFRQLVHHAEPTGVRIVTENFKPLASTKENCLELINFHQGEIGLTVDFGNFKPVDKYHSIETLLPYAESIHAKANYDDDGQIDKEEYERALALVGNSDYDGPITLVYDGPGSLWEGIKRIKAIVEPYC